MIDTEIKHECEETFPCFYRKEGLCAFWEEAEAIPAAWEKVFPDDPAWDDFRAIDTFREPCLTEMEKRDEACAGFHIPFEKGWQDCENCNNSLCPYEGRPFSIGDELIWMKSLPVSGHNARAFMLLRRVMRRLTDRFFWWRHGVWCWWWHRHHPTGRVGVSFDF